VFFLYLFYQTEKKELKGEQKRREIKAKTVQLNFQPKTCNLTGEKKKRKEEELKGVKRKCKNAKTIQYNCMLLASFWG